MWEVLLTAEVGKFVLDKVLDLGKSALEDYVKDFFKGCIEGSISAAKADILKQPMADAIGQFVKRFVKELQINGVEKPSIDHHYGKLIKQFVRDKAVRPVLGKAFETDCKAIDYQQLEKIWQQGYLDSGYRFPEEFDWKGVAKEYVFEVKGIVKGDGELRSLLDIDLQEQQAESLKQVVGVPVTFDLAGYREAIREQYGMLQLESLGSAKYERENVNYRTVSLWQVFVGQSVRECQEYMPQTYEIPKEELKRLQRVGDLEAIAELEVEQKHTRYFQQSPRSVMEILGVKADRGLVEPVTKYMVFLGDPGAGKSTLLRYLAVNWAHCGTEMQIPLLIELRRYIQCKDDGECQDFVEFVHKGSNWVGHLDQLRLDEHLRQGKVLVMFDGLDEVVDRKKRGNVLTQIHGFTQRYPQVPVVVTSRVIGYNAQPLRDAGFQHFMLQDLDRGQIQDFVQRWHELTYLDVDDRGRKQARLSKAIQNSKAIQELAVNPLLLTLMAILNQGEELPRDRARLYEKASEILLYQWDVESKLLEDPRLQKYPIELDYRDKQAMLRRVAYFMQANEKGLAGNFIRREDLENCLKDYLKTRKEASNAPSIAVVMIDQLRERNFILCHLGSDNYGFVHRTFLEYFCATEIVRRFEKARTLAFEQLRDEVFGAHWQDETWHEVLRLICGMLDTKWSVQLIDFLIDFWGHCLEEEEDCDLEGYLIAKGGVENLLFAVKCFQEISDSIEARLLSRRLLDKLKDVPDYIDEYANTECNRDGDKRDISQWDAELIGFYYEQVVNHIAKIWQGESDIQQWLQYQALYGFFGEVQSSAMRGLAGKKIGDEAMAEFFFSASVDTHLLEYGGWRDNPQFIALAACIDHYPTHPKTLELLHDRALNDPDDQLRQWAQEQLQKRSANP